MPKAKKEEYSTLNQIINALLKNQKLDESKLLKLQNAIKEINASNVDDIVRNYLSECLEIRQEIDKLRPQLTHITTIDKTIELNQEVKSIDTKITGIDLDKIKLGSETKEVKTQINNLKKNLISNIEKFQGKLKEQENRLKEKQEIAQEKELPELQKASSAEASPTQSPERGKTEARPKKKKDDKRHSKGKRYKEPHEKNEKKKQYQEEQKIKQEDYVKLGMLLNTILVKDAVVHTMCNNILRLYNEENADRGKSNFQYLLGKESKEFFPILDCYIKLYAAFTKVLNIAETEFISSKDSVKGAKDEFKHLRKDQKAPFKGLLSIFQKQKGKVKIDEIKSNFNSIINVLSKHIVAVPIFSYSNIPEINDINEVKNTLTKGIPILFTQNKCEENSIINERFIVILNNILKNSGYTEKVYKVLEELIKQRQPSPSSSVEEASFSQVGACAGRGQ